MSFDNLNTAVTKKVNLLLMVFLAFIASAVTLFVPFISFAGLAFLPVPAGLLLALNRVRDAVICAVVGVLLFFLFSYVIALVLLVIIAGIAFAYRYLSNRDKKVAFTLVMVFLIFLSSVFLFLLVNSAILQKNSLADISERYTEYVDSLPQDDAISAYKSFLMIEESQFDTVIQQVQSVLRFIPKLLPGLIIVFFGFVTVLNYGFSSLLFKRYNARINTLSVFKDWDLSWYWCWGVITGIVLVIIPSFNSRYDLIIDAAGYNLIIIFGCLYLVLGIATLWGIFERFNIRNSLKYLIMLAIFLFFGLFLFLPVLGLIDIWANFRKLDRSH
ncbi:MAG: DUF2232 domain-containing protein [Actinobacteria bacterium]|nr:DUF2232 domain-containing protein [Actinomycetota bacterium]